MYICIHMFIYTYVFACIYSHATQSQDVSNVYAAFSNELWLWILAEIMLVWLLFLATEGDA